MALVHWLLSALALLITAYVVPGFKVKSFKTALITCLVIGLANIIIRPILLFLTLPLNILTLGLFTFVVNAVILRICASILRDFSISGWFSAIVGAVVLSFIGAGFHVFAAHVLL
jgi:putative membrane protein